MQRQRMDIRELRRHYATHKKVVALAEAIKDDSVKTITLEGFVASSAPLSLGSVETTCVKLFILEDADEAGYFYHDISQIADSPQDVLFYPSPYRCSAKDGQRDAANEILRTEVLAKLSNAAGTALTIVTFTEAVEEEVIDAKHLSEATITLRMGETHDITALATTLRQHGFTETDYVYEPGEFALRGSILDVYSYSSEQPLRIDFFGDDIDSIRTFEVDTQLSGEKRQVAEIVADMEQGESERVPFDTFLPEGTLVVTKSHGFTCKKKGKASGRDVTITFNTSPQLLFHKNFDLICTTFEEYILRGYEIYILADSAKQQERIAEILKAQGSDQKAPTFVPVNRTLHEGFADNDLKVCLFTDHQIFDRYHKYNLKSDKARRGKVALTLKEIKQFAIGDYVVHVDHGVGRFCGLLRMPQGDGYQEVIKIQYKGGDSIYVSIHSLYKVAKYKAQETGEPPRMSRLGTEQWEHLKERTKAKIKDIARDLIKLYAQRRKEKGFAFSADSYMQHELEASFLYEDTPDQLRATADVKADMEERRPMDRLVCGDVGFGKTEVAVRAAFKAACDSKQVAVLVPTTVLAYQHYHTFSSRLKDLPVRVEYLSRARTAKQVTAILKDLKDGKIDILIGTHKIIGKNVKFHDLGLLIIDEEQKFGVAVKEKLRQMKVNIDTLTMTATPIPRTLQFSLVGARDLSIIRTPPPNRYPIQTEIHTFDAEVISDAINFEMSRNGQVFFVNNRINDLPSLEMLIHKHVPQARIAMGHGQMKTEELEEIIMDFANYDYDVLISTTIIENGLDIPNANTIIINGAHNFGLSDLHQMRGRVGRSNRKAFCYLLAPPRDVLTPEARRRLEALENFSDLGSGINIAMQDLDIRGAGNLLGSEQSGFIAELGYETYQKILAQAVTELRNDEFAELYGEKEKVQENAQMKFVDDCTFESDMELYFPASYVPGDSERMLLYRELDGFKDDRDLDSYRERLRDRFGEIPETAEELIRVVPLRHLACELGIERAMLKQGKLTLFFVSNENSPYYQSPVFDAVLTYITQNPRRCNVREVKGKRSLVIDKVTTVKEAVEVLKAIWDAPEKH